MDVDPATAAMFNLWGAVFILLWLLFMLSLRETPDDDDWRAIHRAAGPVGRRRRVHSA
jgi:hypothetical protein